MENFLHYGIVTIDDKKLYCGAKAVFIGSTAELLKQIRDYK
jgi:hypothetical protein